ncbi:MAG: hypothetical protein PVG82_03525 [Chromatiales bacterium]
MPVEQSWFRPWLDEPGPWDVWSLQPEQQATLRALVDQAVESAIETLDAAYGREATAFDPAGLVRRLAAEPSTVQPWFSLARAILARDYYLARARCPRPESGGQTNPTNRKRWARIEPYGFDRLRACLSANLTESLLIRAAYGRLPDDGSANERLLQRLRRQVEAAGLFESFELSLNLKAPLPGGRRRVNAETATTLEWIRAELRERRPVLVEVIRDSLEAPGDAQIILVYRLEEQADGWLRLDAYDPVHEAEPVGFRLRTEGQSMIYDRQPDEQRPAPKGLRRIVLEDAGPPLFGLRRWLRWVLPWRPLWWLKRRWLIALSRKRDQQAWQGIESPEQPAHP